MTLLGYTRATMGSTTESLDREVMQNLLKASLSSDCRLQLACMKPESLIADRPARRGEYVPDAVHTRHTTRVCNTRSRWGSFGASRLGGIDDWGEVNKVAVSEGAAGSPPF